MPLVAQTNIKHGYTDDEGRNVEIYVEEGEVIPDDLFDEDTLESLLESDTLVEPVTYNVPGDADRIEAADSEIAALRALLEQNGIDPDDALVSDTEDDVTSDPED